MARSCSRGAWIGRRAHGGSGSNSMEAQSVPISHKENVPLTHKRPPCPHTNRCIKKNRVCCPVSSPSFLKTDRKSTRLNSSHSQISYAVFCLKRKNRRHMSY